MVAALIIGFGVYMRARGADTPSSPSTPDISGVVEYRASDPAMLTSNHVQGSVAYKVSPPVGDDHSAVRQT